MRRRVLLRYMSGHYLANMAGAILGLVALIELLDLLNNATDVLDRKLGVAGLGTYMLLRMPATLDQAITLGVLIGGIVTFAKASRHNEIVAMRAAGITIYQLGALLLPCAALAAIAHFVIADQLMPRSARALSVWWQSSALPGDDGADNSDTEDKDKPLWFRVGDDMVSIAQMDDGGRKLIGVRIYRRDANGALAGRTVAREAVYSGGSWTLEDVVKTHIATRGAQDKTMRTETWDARLTPADVVELGIPAARLSTQASRSVLEGAAASNRAPSFYEMQINEIYANALAAFLMLLLSLPAAFSSRRDGSGGKLVLVSLALGLLYLLSNGVLNAFGESGTLPPFVATWGALIIFAMAGTTLLLNLED